MSSENEHGTGSTSFGVGLAVEGQPAEPAEGDEQPCGAPGGDDEHVGAGEAGSLGVRVVGGEAGGCEVADGKHAGDLDQPDRRAEAATNTPEMKHRCSMTAWVTGWAASWSWMTDARA